MSAKRGDSDDEDDYVAEKAPDFDDQNEDDDDDDDDEEEDEFVPGMDDEDDDDIAADSQVDDDEASAIDPILQGTLAWKPNAPLIYKNEADTFAFESKSPLDCVSFPPDNQSIVCSGRINSVVVPSLSLRFVPQQFAVVQHDVYAIKLLTEQRQIAHKATSSSPSATTASVSRKKKPPPSSAVSYPKAPSPSSDVVYTVVAERLADAEDGDGGSLVQFTGFTGFLKPSDCPSSVPTSEGGRPADYTVQFPLICLTQTVTVSARPTSSPSATASAASATAASETKFPTAAAAAARPARRSGHNDDSDDDDDVENDGGVEYNELIALHDDANLSLEELRRRYQRGHSNVLTSARPSRPRKPPPPSRGVKRPANPSIPTSKRRKPTDDNGDVHKSNAQSLSNGNLKKDDSDSDEDDDIGF